MSEVLQKVADIGVLTEVSEVVRTVTLVMNKRYYRIEVLREYHPSDSDNGTEPSYIVRYYQQETITAQPTYPRSDGQYERSPDEMTVWKVAEGYPWVHMPSPELALHEALGFLEGRI